MTKIMTNAFRQIQIYHQLDIIAQMKFETMSIETASRFSFENFFLFAFFINASIRRKRLQRNVAPRDQAGRQIRF